MEFVIVASSLCLLNAYQLWYWSRQNSRLVDKIMSKNYAEYVQSEHLAKKPSQKSRTQNQPQITDDEVLKELNGLFGGQ